MPIFKEVRELLMKYSFVERVELKGANVLLFYKDGEQTKVSKIPYRATKDQLIDRIENIKDSIGYYKAKKERDAKIRAEVKKELTKPLIFANVGEEK